MSLPESIRIALLVFCETTSLRKMSDPVLVINLAIPVLTRTLEPSSIRTMSPESPTNPSAPPIIETSPFDCAETSTAGRIKTESSATMVTEPWAVETSANNSTSPLIPVAVSKTSAEASCIWFSIRPLIVRLPLVSRLMSAATVSKSLGLESIIERLLASTSP